MLLTIDDRAVELADGASVLDAVNQLGLPLPQLCKDPDRPALGASGGPVGPSGPGGRGGVLLVHETRRLGLSLLPVVAWRLLLATALAVAVAALAAWLLAGRLTAPLARLVAAARRVGEGDLSTRVQVDADGEVAAVASAFNDMAAGLERAPR